MGVKIIFQFYRHINLKDSVFSFEHVFERLGCVSAVWSGAVGTDGLKLPIDYGRDDNAELSPNSRVFCKQP